MRSIGILLISLFSPSAQPATGETCLALDGERITAEDLVPVWPALREIPGKTVFGYAPLPGARRVFYPLELARLAARYQVAPPGSRICVERLMEHLRPESLLTALRTALAGEEAHIQILEYSRYPVPRGELEFQRKGLSPPSTGGPESPILWKGTVRYSGNHRFAVWVRVRISANLRRVVAIENLRAGHPVGPEQLRVETLEGFPLGRTEATTPNQVIGRCPRRSLLAGAPIPLNLLEEPPIVGRGDEVSVEVDTGAAHLSLTGRAESAGRRGETVSVRNLASGKTFPAQVAEKGQVRVRANNPKN